MKPILFVIIMGIGLCGFAQEPTTWRKVQNPYNFYVLSIYFVNDTTGFLGGASGFILRSYDGGLHWNDTVHLPRNDVAVNDFVFSTNDTGFAVGPVYRTFDKGNSWSNLTPPINFGSEIEQAGSQRWFVSSGPYSCSLLKTENNFSTYGYQNIPAVCNKFAGVFHLQFLSANVGYFLAGGRGSHLDDGAYLMRTTDNSQSWQIAFFFIRFGIWGNGDINPGQPSLQFEQARQYRSGRC